MSLTPTDLIAIKDIVNEAIETKVPPMITAAIEKAVGTLTLQIGQGFNEVSERFERVETRVDHLESDVATLKTDVAILKTDVRKLKWVNS